MALPIIEGLGAITSLSVRTSEIRAGGTAIDVITGEATAGSLTLSAFHPQDDTQFTSIIMTNDGAAGTIAVTSNFGDVTIGGVALPQLDSDVATKGYVDPFTRNQSAKNSAAAVIVSAFVSVASDAQSVTISNATIFPDDVVVLGTGNVTVNGVVIPALGDPAAVFNETTLLPGNRVLLVFGEAGDARAGVYYLSTAAPTSAVFVRCADMSRSATGNELKVGSHVLSGTTGYIITAMDDPFVLGTGLITFSRYNLGDYTGSALVSVDAGARSISISSSNVRGQVLAATSAAGEPEYTSTIGPESAAVIGGLAANLPTVRDPGAHDGTFNAGGLVFDGPNPWPGDGTTTGQSVYHGNPAAIGTMRTIMTATGTLNSPLYVVQRWDGGAWGTMMAIGQ